MGGDSGERQLIDEVVNFDALGQDFGSKFKLRADQYLTNRG